MWVFSKENSFFSNLSFLPPFKKLPTFCLTFMLFFVFWIGRSVFKMTLCVSTFLSLLSISISLSPFVSLTLSLSFFLCLCLSVYLCLFLSLSLSLESLTLSLSFCINFLYLCLSVSLCFSLSLSHTRLFCLCLSEIMLMFYFPCFYLSVHDYRGEKIPLATTLSIATRAFGEMK